MKRAPLPMRVELPAALAPLADRSAWRRDVAAGIAAEIGALADMLGLPVGAEVELGVLAAPRSACPLALRLHANGRHVGVGPQTVLRAAALVYGRPAETLPQDDLLHAAVEQADSTSRLMAQLARAAVARDPALLLGPAQVAALGGAAGLPPSLHERWGRVAASVLRQGVGVGEVPELDDRRTEIADPLPAEDEIAERWIAAARPRTIGIRMTQSTLRGLTLEAGRESREAFERLREGLLYELGLRLPACHLIEDESLPAGVFAFTLNDVAGLPWRALERGERLVNAEPSSLPGALAARYPENGWLCSITQGDPPDPTLTSLSGWGHMLMCLNAELRSLGSRLLDLHTLEAELERLERDRPALLRIVRRRLRPAQLLALLRELLGEGMPLCDLAGLLESVVSLRSVPVDSTRSVVFGDRLPGHGPAGPLSEFDLQLAAARRGCAEQLVRVLADTNQVVRACLLEQDFERVLGRLPSDGTRRAGDPWCDAVVDRIAEALPAWGDWPWRPPVLLTNLGVRRPLRRLLADELPHLPVLSYFELTESARVVVDARIEAPETPPATA